MEYSTHIDSVGIQIECYSHEEQVKIVEELLDFIINNKTLHFNHRDYPIGMGSLKSRIYFIHSKRRRVATISTNTYMMIKGANRFKTVYYIKVKFAGLKSYSEASDKASEEFLFGMSSYLNRRKIKMKITELDVCIDAKCNFENMLVLCTKKAPRTMYYGVYDMQIYKGTKYIEYLDKYKVKTATKRAYYYDKRYKENLKEPTSRFELKLQRKFFYINGFNIEAIEKALDRYHVMYFKNVNKMSEKIQAYNSYTSLRKKDVESLGLDRYRLKPNMMYIQSFINKLQTIGTYAFQQPKNTNNSLSKLV